MLTSLNVHFDSEVMGVDLSYNNLTSWVIPNSNYFDYFELSHNLLTSLTIDNAHFEYFNIAYNNLTSIQGTGFISHQGIFNYNQFSLLDLSQIHFDYESTLYLGNNPQDIVDFGFGNSPGNIVYTSNNTFFDAGNFSSSTSCDPENTGNITIINCPNLQHLILKNGHNHTQITCNEGGTIFNNPSLNLQIANCPNLSFICVDELERPFIQSEITNLGLQNQVEVNSYCTFTPGGTYYTINGASRYDYNSNGCDASDFPIPNQQFTISSGAQSGTVIANASGNYTITLGAGTHTITPIIQNPDYFNVSPPSVTASFPTDTSPYVQNFCLTPNGNHPDLEVSLVPTFPARPGFDAPYKLVYRNKGNQVQSGSIQLNYNDAVLDFVSAIPSIQFSSPNTLTWDFDALQPFESREILFTMNVNSPVETPAVNGGDVLAYTATITGGATDDTPADNTAALNQSVVNSYDPNDKTCLEGTYVLPEMAGQYVHYQIRFENTGTAAAQNIVVVDMIDTDKFDIASLVALNGSHNFYTRVNGNKVEFIFENIDLPFDDANNDGYVLFKVKTKPTLVLGDTFSNTASIYFDYNHPIVTEPAVTTFALLNTQDFAFEDYFALYPNPAGDLLQLQSKSDVAISSISVYNMLGQLIMTVPNAKHTQTIDVSQLKSGNYFLTIQSNEGKSNRKFIKK